MAAPTKRLGLRLGYRTALDGDCCLREEPPLYRRASVQSYRRLGQHDPFEVRCRPDVHGSGNLPKNVIGNSAAGERDVGSVSDSQVFGDLKIQTSVTVPLRFRSVGMSKPVPHL